MKNWLTGLLLIGLFAVSINAEKVSADELNNKETESEKVYVEADENVTLEDDKTFVLDNGVTITANKVTDSYRKGFASKLIGINATPPPPNGDWDYLGSSTFSYESGVFHSTGGDIRIQISLSYKPHRLDPPYVLQLREQDTVFSPKISELRTKEAGTWELSVRGLNDGDNNLSELFIRKTTHSFRDVYTRWWD